MFTAVFGGDCCTRFANSERRWLTSTTDDLPLTILMPDSITMAIRARHHLDDSLSLSLLIFEGYPDAHPPFFKGGLQGGRRDLLTTMIYTHVLTGAVVSFAALQKEIIVLLASIICEPWNSLPLPRIDKHQFQPIILQKRGLL